MPNVFKSRKFYAALTGLAFVFFGARAGLTEEQLKEAVYLIMTYIGGVALEKLGNKG